MASQAAATAERWLATALTNYFNMHADQFIPNVMAVNNLPQGESKGSCRCCGALGKTISGCSCWGGKPHVCRKLEWKPKVRRKYCGATERTATGRSCIKGKSPL